MSELRLVPPAAAVWLAAGATIVAGWWWGAAVACFAAAFLLLFRQPGQALLSGGLGVISTVITQVRVTVARSWDFGDGAVGRIVGQPKKLESGTWLVQVRPDGYPDTVAVFVDSLPQGTVTGARVHAEGTVGQSAFASVGTSTLSGSLDVLESPIGFAAWSEQVRDTFAGAAQRWLGDDSEGLLPGMVLGDTSLQTAEEKQDYIATGLSHLSAVSGANCMYVAAAALALARLARCGLRAQLISAGIALLLYAAMVGPEPSVLRATVSGLVGLTAILSSTRAEPIHALCLSVVGLVLVDSALAVDYAFALSVAATAGIIAVSPLIYRAIAGLASRARVPDLLCRAFAVAVAADVVTAPIIAAMAGRVSLVSVLANVVVSPVTGLITVLGFLAVTLAQIPGASAATAALCWAIEPMTWWVRNVARNLSGMGLATVPAAPLTVVVVYGWVIAALVAPRMWIK